MHHKLPVIVQMDLAGRHLWTIGTGRLPVASQPALPPLPRHFPRAGGPDHVGPRRQGTPPEGVA